MKLKKISYLQKNLQNEFNLQLDMAPFSSNVATSHTFHEIRSQNIVSISFMHILYVSMQSYKLSLSKLITVLRNITSLCMIILKLVLYNTSLCWIYLATSIMFDAPPKWSAHSEKTILRRWKTEPRLLWSSGSETSSEGSSFLGLNLSWGQYLACQCFWKVIYLKLERSVGVWYIYKIIYIN